MTLTLSIIGDENAIAGDIPAQRLDGERLTIGRAENADWTLPDPTMVLSRMHCVIEQHSDAFFLTDTSSNGVFINDEIDAIGRDHTAELRDGDFIRMGEYVIQVAIASENGNARLGSAPDTESFPNDSALFGIPDRQIKPGEDSLGMSSTEGVVSNLTEPLSAEDPPADVLGDIERDESDDPLNLSEAATLGESVQSHPDHALAERQYYRPPEPLPDSAAADFAEHPVDPLAEPPETDYGDDAADGHGPPASDAQEIIPDLEDSLIKRIAQHQVDAVMPPPLKPFPGVAAESDDPFAEVSAAAAAPDDAPEPPPSEQKSTPRTAATPANDPPDPRQDPVSAAGGSASQRPEAAAGDVAAALAAFIKGTGLKQTDLQGQDAETVLYNAGLLLRQTTEGMMQILRARSTIRNELRVERTVIGYSANPLKVLPHAEEALPLLLAATGKNWMPANEALVEGFNDIVAHEMAMMAGLQAALQALLAELDPELLEQDFGDPAKLGILGVGRKARCWDAYKHEHRKLVAAAEEDIQRLFGVAFARAYQNQQLK